VPKGYWVSVYRTISDPERLAAYDKLAGPAVRLGGGRTFARGGRVVGHEAGKKQRVVLIEFDSFEQALAAYESGAYQEALVALSDGVERDFRIVEGIDSPPGSVISTSIGSRIWSRPAPVNHQHSTQADSGIRERTSAWLVRGCARTAQAPHQVAKPPRTGIMTASCR
jgi:uncharacterized protein (DUF1330 family)